MFGPGVEGNVVVDPEVSRIRVAKEDVVGRSVVGSFGDLDETEIPEGPFDGPLIGCIRG